MKTIIAGSRSCSDMFELLEAIAKCNWEVTSVVSGTAKGADSLGEEWAGMKGIPIEKYPADWSKYGKYAGHVRNTEMAKNAEALIVLWDGFSAGTKNMINTAKRLNLKTYIHMV